MISSIRKDNSYIYGEVTGTGRAQADSLAVCVLCDKIAETAGFTTYNQQERRELMRGYFGDVRKNSLAIYMGKNYSFRYISRNDVSKVFADRKAKINEMLQIADKAEKERNIDVALRYYTWASVLLRSVPPLESAKIADISQKANLLMDLVKVKYSATGKSEQGLIELTFTYKGQPVQTVDYRFFDGKKWSGVLSATDGKGFAQASPGTSMKDYRIKYEIDQSRLQNIWREVSQIEKALDIRPERTDNQNLAVAGRPSEDNAGARTQTIVPANHIQRIDWSDVKKKILDVVAQKDATLKDSLEFSFSPVMFTEKYESSIEKICNALTNNSYEGIDTLFTAEGYDTFRKLLTYGHARVLHHDDLFYYKLGDEVFARSLPLVFSYRENNKEFVESIVFTFDKDNKISNLSFSLGRVTAADIASHETWPEEAKIILMTFLENYKTAYALKRTDYIRSIFDEDALIITGRILKNAGKANEYGAGKYVSLTRQSKAEYIQRLEKVFASQEFINVQFTDCKVLRLGKIQSLYGIQIRQEYYSSTYSDSGYLFILVDLQDSTKPVIHVRTWQEAPDKDFGVIGPYNF